jgi:pimeloyl-ACP methyl ester carboxylesterase
MKKIFIFLAGLFSFSVVAFGQNIEGAWSGNLNVQGMKIPLVLHIVQNGDSLSSTMDSPAQGAKGIAIDKTGFTNHQLNFEIKALSVSYEGRLEGDSIAGIFTQGGANLSLVFKKSPDKKEVLHRPQTPTPPFDYAIEDVSFTNASEGNILAGTLTTPHHKTQFPVAIMITGSGAQDRDETIFGHKPFWVIADHLAKNGIGVLRLDDRGVGGSSAGKANATSADFATDIDAAVNFLVKKGFKNIGLIGHSEGGFIAPMVANKNKNVKFIVSMAGPGIPNDEVMVLQLEAMNKVLGIPDSVMKWNLDFSKSLYGFVKSYTGNNLQSDLKAYVLNYLKTDSGQITSDKTEAFATSTVGQVGSEWFQYFLKHDPRPDIEKLKIPVLALNGTKDMQVIAKENLAGWKTALEKAKNKNFKIVSLTGLNHLFQEAKTGAPMEYGEIEQTISPQALDVITSWIGGLGLK